MTEIRKNIISVITVCYNAENNLERTILSVLNQTYSNIEYIIMQGVILKKADDNIICSIQIQVVILKRGVMQFGKYMF